ncbi:MAG: sulfate adenylyltransferase [Deinococcales bacterium]
MTDTLIAPHGGTLVDRRLAVGDRAEAQAAAGELPRLALDERSLADLECIATGIYSPLKGFVNEGDYASIVESGRLQSGLAWSIPITLQVSEAQAEALRPGQELALTGGDGAVLATMRLTDIYQPDQCHEAERVYGTADAAHPGVAAMLAAGPVYLGGPVTVVAELPSTVFDDHKYDPHATRAEFAKRGWSTVVAFQTRNPIHRAHEYLTKVALETVDGLFINPLVGTTKKDDIPAEVRMECYYVLLDNYYPKERVHLGVYPAAMRYAGPREAILHAISRQNYGCSHFIVGRDHAGVGEYYGTYDAQRAFDGYSRDELAIQPMKFEHSFYCKACGSMASTKSCPHDASQHVFLSGTKVRAMLAAGEMPPAEFSRPEVARILMDAQNGNGKPV